MKRERRAAALLLIGLALLASACQTAPRAHAEQGSPRSEGLVVMCSADRLFLETGEPVALRAYTHPKDDGSFRYTWTSTAGRIDGTGAQVQWHLAGTAPGIYQLTLQVADPQGRSATTQVQVVVIKPLGEKGGRYTTGRAFLVGSEKEETGYGLYSYVLLGSRPADAPTRERYLSTIRAYLRLSHVLTLLDALIEKQQINVTYVPLTTAPEPDLLKKLEGVDETKYTEAAAWVLDNYHYARAQAWLNKLDGDHLDGPYIVSFRSPMGGATLEPPYLYQDQSTAPPSVTALWMKEFIMQAAQERFWERQTMYHVLLSMRTYVAIIGEGVPPIEKELTRLIDLKEKLKGSASPPNRAIAAAKTPGGGIWPTALEPRMDFPRAQPASPSTERHASFRSGEEQSEGGAG